MIVDLQFVLTKYCIVCVCVLLLRFRSKLIEKYIVNILYILSISELGVINCCQFGFSQIYSVHFKKKLNFDWSWGL